MKGEMKKEGKRGIRTLGAALALSLGTTVVLIALEGRVCEALPLHLCSISALAALWLSLGPRALPLDFLWYLGIPGALLALIFPAPAFSRWQTLLNASYFATHALIVLIPCAVIARGTHPRSGRAAQMMILLQALALIAFAVNRYLGTDFMFLMAPPTGTPLTRVFAWGYFPYLLTLEGIMLATALLMGGLLSGGRFAFGRKRWRKDAKICK